MANPINKAATELLNNALIKLEEQLDCDVLNYYGAIMGGIENELLDIIEKLADDQDKRDRLAVILTTNGGSSETVERYVNMIRKHYEKVIFIVPDYAFSAGTIFCMSGDEIWMDYFSALGPIDPQVPNKDGKYVPALGYLDKINELLTKAQANTISDAEFLILKDFDLAELRFYEQAKELTIDLLKRWLVKYKFKNWDIHSSTGLPVSDQDKQNRAEEIAAALGNNNIWKTHGRPINIEELEDLKLKIEDYSNRPERELIRNYYNLMRDFSRQYYNGGLFIHTRKFI